MKDKKHKVCKVCGIELTQANKKKGYRYCKPCYTDVNREMSEKFRREHPERFRELNLKSYYKNRDAVIKRTREYWERTKEERHKAQKRWRDANKDRHSSASKTWYYNNRDRVLKRIKERLKTVEGIEARRRIRQTPTARQKDIIRITKRRRDLGFQPLNNFSDGTVAHHVDKNNVIYIPEDIHKAVPHQQKNEDSMIVINTIAFSWMEMCVL